MPKILTIEDDESLVLDMTRTLAASGFLFDIARTGREGMAKAMAGDDYLCKPFSFKEMAVRIEALLRRSPRGTETETVLRTGQLELDLIGRKVRRRERELKLKPTEFRVLEFMMRHPDQVLTREAIFKAVWGYEFVPGTNLIDVHIGRLRRKVHVPGERPVIRTIRGSGYRFG